MRALLSATTILSLVGQILADQLPFRAPSNITQRLQHSVWPRSYFALGDSFAAGFGAGKFYRRDDIENKRRKRYEGSYPAIAKSLDVFQSVRESAFKFSACSGDYLRDIDRQRADLDKAHVVSLSISGNDFDFVKVIKACIYNTPKFRKRRDQQCDDALLASEQKIRNQTIWEKYKAKVVDIMENNMEEDAGTQMSSVLVITGI